MIHGISRSLFAFSTLALLGSSNAVRAQWSTLDDPFAGSLGTLAEGIDGSNIVGYYGDSSGNHHGFLYNGNNYTTLDDPLAVSTFASGISGNSIVGNYYDSNGLHGFLYNGSTYTTLNDPFGQLNIVFTGIDGSNIVGYVEIPLGDSQGYLYNTNTQNYTTLNDPLADSFGTFAEGISGIDVVGGYFRTGHTAYGFLYNGTIYTTLDDPFGVSTVATGISGSNIVGYYSDSSGEEHGFLYNGTTYTTLDDPFGVSTVATGISGSNIVGYYSDSSGEEHGFVYNMVPEPGSLAILVGIGNAGGCFLTRRRRC